MKYFRQNTACRAAFFTVLGSIFIALALIHSGGIKASGSDLVVTRCDASATRVIASHARCLVRSEAALQPEVRERRRQRCKARFEKAEESWNSDHALVCGALAVLDTAWNRMWRAVKRVGRAFQFSSDTAPVFIDNGDGTVTDHASGLMWEKKDEDGGLHDVDRKLALDDDAYDTGDLLDDVNRESGTGFAGYDDWRLPTFEELQSLVNYDTAYPSAYDSFSVCSDGCVQTSCSCMSQSNYWTSSVYVRYPSTYAWTVSFADGRLVPRSVTGAQFVRFVRDLR